MNRIVVVGSLNADLVARALRAPSAGETVTGEKFAVYNGGKGANQAVAAALLGGRVSMLGRVGTDIYGESLKNGLRGAGVDVSRVSCIESETTGVALITVEAGGENRIVVIPGANGRYLPDELRSDATAFEGASVALFQLETPRETVALGLRMARESGCITILDPAPVASLSDEVLSLVDYLTPNVSELAALSGVELGEEPDDAAVESAARVLMARGGRAVLAKLGAGGALLVDARGTERVRATLVKVVDTTAAGDCFNGAFAVALARGEEAVGAVRFACGAASLSVTRAGAQASLPTAGEVERFLAKT